MINKFLGYHIKRQRLEKNMSQESLCKGICAVSYLSKIENGTVNANNEIIEQLFKALGITYIFDENFTIDIKDLFKEYFDAYFWNEDIKSLAEKVELMAPQIKNSKYAILYELYMISRIQSSYKDGANLSIVTEKLSFLSDFIDYMTKEEKFLYYLFCANESEDKKLCFENLHKADDLIPCSYTMLSLANSASYYGNYVESLKFVSIGMQRAFNEGYLPALKELSIIECNCYANLNETRLMHLTFERALNFNRDNKVICSTLEYNVGATYISLSNYEKAIHHLLKAYSSNPTFLCCQKLCLAYIRINDSLNAQKFLDNAKVLLSNEDNESLSLFNDMLNLLEIMLKENYLDDEKYSVALENLYSNINKTKPHGYGNFYIPLLKELYTHTRQYKKAFELCK